MCEKDLNQKYAKNDPEIKKFLACIPPQIAATFTNSQLIELKRVFSNRFTSSNQVDIRLSIPFFTRRFYVVLLIGKDKRDKNA